MVNIHCKHRVHVEDYCRECAAEERNRIRELEAELTQYRQVYADLVQLEPDGEPANWPQLLRERWGKMGARIRELEAENELIRKELKVARAVTAQKAEEFRGHIRELEAENAELRTQVEATPKVMKWQPRPLDILEDSTVPEAEWMPQDLSELENFSEQLAAQAHEHYTAIVAQLKARVAELESTLHQPTLAACQKVLREMFGAAELTESYGMYMAELRDAFAECGEDVAERLSAAVAKEMGGKETSSKPEDSSRAAAQYVCDRCGEPMPTGLLICDNDATGSFPCGGHRERGRG